jgi:hypothetical protein
MKYAYLLEKDTNRITSFWHMMPKDPDSTTVINITEEEVDLVHQRKLYDYKIENNTLIYDPIPIPQDVQDENTRQQLRQKRKMICFPIINRGKLWYDTLTSEQLEELRTWYNAWLNCTTTLIEPVTPSWIAEE